MVKDVNKTHEMAAEACSAQARRPGELVEQYKEEVLIKEKMLWLKLFLHLADVSNPLKPFELCASWAYHILDEFFAQGDEEKRLGLPVGMLNDRDKINRPGSQHGFINFLVAPLVTNAVRLFPPMHSLSTQMASNLAEWKTLWVKDVQPSAEDVAKREADVNKVAETAQELVDRTNP